MNSIFTIIMLLVMPVTLNACECVNFTPVQQISNAEYIYAGIPIKAEIIEGKGLKTTFEVIKQFKGTTDTIEIVWSRADSASCGLQYSFGKEHVVLADANKRVSSCTGYDEFYPIKYEGHPAFSDLHTGILSALRKDIKHNHTSKKTQK